MAETLKLEVPERLEGDRIDKALADLLDLSRAQARLLLDAGVLVDGAPARPSDRVRAGAEIVSPVPVAVVEVRAEPVEFGVIHEDPNLIVVDKPPGLVVHPGAGRKDTTLAAGLLHRYPELEGVGTPGRWGLVHRLDRDTSGVLLVARTQAAYEQLSSDLKRRHIGRVYIALVHGSFATPTGTIDAPIGRDLARPTRRAVISGGKPAVTHYELIEAYPESDVSLLEVRLETGRTHQIRVHMAAIDHPVLGDRTYSTLNHPVKPPRIFLHARTVELNHPTSGEKVSYSAPLPTDLTGVLSVLARRALGE
ncbi:MAG: RluA family pseudouridine synthase [Acidimicrobiia bacterium]